MKGSAILLLSQLNKNLNIELDETVKLHSQQIPVAKANGKKKDLSLKDTKGMVAEVNLIVKLSTPSNQEEIYDYSGLFSQISIAIKSDHGEQVYQNFKSHMVYQIGNTMLVSMHSDFGSIHSGKTTITTNIKNTDQIEVVGGNVEIIKMA